MMTSAISDNESLPDAFEAFKKARTKTFAASQRANEFSEKHHKSNEPTSGPLNTAKSKKTLKAKPKKPAKVIESPVETEIITLEETSGQEDNATTKKSPDLCKSTRTPIIQKTKRSSEMTSFFGRDASLPRILTQEPELEQTIIEPTLLQPSISMAIEENSFNSDKKEAKVDNDDHSNKLKQAMEDPSFYSKMSFATNKPLHSTPLPNISGTSTPLSLQKKREIPISTQRAEILNSDRKQKTAFLSKIPKESSAEIQLMLSLKNYMNKLTADKETHKVDVTETLNGNVSLLKDDISSINSRITSIETTQLLPIGEKLDQVCEKYDKEVPVLSTNYENLQGSLDSVERVINTLITKLGTLENVIENKTEHLQANINETIKHVNDDLAARDRGDDINREMFSVALNRLTRGEVFIENQKVDNENIRDTIQNVEEMFLNKHETDCEAIHDRLNLLTEKLDAVIDVQKSFLLESESRHQASFKRKLENISEGRINKRQKLIKYGRVAVNIAIGVVAVYLAASSQ